MSGPFKMKGSPYKKPKKKKNILEVATAQKNKTIADLTKKAESEGLSGPAAKKAAKAEYKRNI